MATLKTNTLTGTSTAGSIAVTGEGNSTTTNLQQGLCKAWINFNGTGTIATRDSFNVGSITDNAVGDYTNSFTNSMSSGDYVEVDGSVLTGSTRGTFMEGDNHSSLSGSFRVTYALSDDATDGTLDGDPHFVKRAFHGDLA